jgi:hypothetical protein
MARRKGPLLNLLTASAVRLNHTLGGGRFNPIAIVEDGRRSSICATASADTGMGPKDGILPMYVKWQSSEGRQPEITNLDWASFGPLIC